MYRHLFKRISDCVISVILFMILLPVFTVIVFLLMIFHRGNPFFLQPRPGKQGKIFRIIKFKTMNDRKDKDGNLLPDAERLTGIGQWIRTTSLDEIPQLLNVVKGDMSLVGPRPLLPDYLPLYNEQQKRRHEVRPGITGWAQVHGRNTISWEKKFDLDVWYVDHLSLQVDLKILFLTIKKVCVREGISSDTSVTMEPFTGTNQ
ncbi:MAG: sugar transferase [Tannerellaceae bacterium]|nr:sugar transferase [Tannerellaceae bacterium]MCC8198957.1 sugar transferase [Tannerellaceae bacterium]